jgi:hypothetical protein
VRPVPDFLGLLLAQPSLYVDAGNAMATGASQLEAGNATFTTATGGMPGWTGSARDAQNGASKTASANVDAAVNSLRNAGGALVTGGTSLTEDTMTLRTSVDEILGLGYGVLGSGLVVVGEAQLAEAAAATVGGPEILAGYEAGAAAYTAELDLIIEGATATDVEIAEQLQTAGAAIGLGPPAASPLRLAGPALTVPVAQRQFMSPGEWRRKMNLLKDLSDRGLLYKRVGTVDRDRSITQNYRAFTMGRIRRLYNTTNPTFRDQLLHDITPQAGVARPGYENFQLHPDHRWELQLGGPDARGNLWWLSGDTNTDIGTQQIWRSIQTAPDGTPVEIEVQNFDDEL